jgi:hypothetical protein
MAAFLSKTSPWNKTPQRGITKGNKQSISSFETVYWFAFYSTTSNRYQCDMCDLNFKYPSMLLRHRNMHTKEFKCTLCKYSAARMAILMKHMKMHESDDEQSSSSTVIDK